MNNLSGSLSFNGNVSGQMGANLITNVEANPSGTATQTLVKIRVGDIIYSIPTGGGGGGVTSYSLLTDKPKINNHTIDGEMTATDLDLQDKIDFPGDGSKYLDGNGNFSTPPYISSYLDISDKPQINGVVLTGNKTSDDLDLSNKAHVNELSGASVDFQNGQELPLLKCIADIEPVQSGSGTPSPSNIRPISGHTDVTVTVASTSGGSGEDTIVSLGRTVYVGTLDITTGVLKVTHGFKTYTGDASENWIYTSSLNRVYINIADAIKPSTYAEIQSNILHYSLRQEDYGSYINDQGNLIVYAPSNITNVSLWKTWLTSNNLQVVYELATPQTVQLTPERVRTKMGVNNISANTGDIDIIYINNVNDPAIEFILNNL